MDDVRLSETEQDHLNSKGKSSVLRTRPGLRTSTKTVGSRVDINKPLDECLMNPRTMDIAFPGFDEEDAKSIAPCRISSRQVQLLQEQDVGLIKPSCSESSITLEALHICPLVLVQGTVDWKALLQSSGRHIGGLQAKKPAGMPGSRA